ncbi:MAG: MoxR family ATPase, partial [Chloroflexota bacterium]
DKDERGRGYLADPNEIKLVNAALYLRRPLLLTGNPGTGKSSLAYAVAHELNLGEVLKWSITTRSTLREGLYDYDALGRLQEIATLKQTTAVGQEIEPPDIGQFMKLGPLGTALVTSLKEQPRVLLVDEIDKSDVDLPNDLLNVFEEGEFEIPELVRLSKETAAVKVRCYDSAKTETILGGRVKCQAFPFIILTSNGEREFPPAFLRRCLRLDIEKPDAKRLREIVATRLGSVQAEKLIQQFLAKQESGLLATDQLLNVLYLKLKNEKITEDEALVKILLEHLNQ